MSTPCARCGAPTDAYVCRNDAQSLAKALAAAAGHAEDAWTVIARLVRYGGRGTRGTDEAPLPNLTASRRLAAASHTVETWCGHLHTQPEPWRVMAGPLCPPRRPGDPPRPGGRCDHGSCHAIRERTPPTALAEALQLLARHTDQLRHREDAPTAFRQLHDLCDDLAQLVDRPPGGHRLVGMCDCGKILYAPHGRDIVTCKPCGARWNVTESQGILLRHLDGKLVTVPEALDMAGWLDTDRTREQIRKLLMRWIAHGQILAHGHVVDANSEVQATYLFGEIRTLLDQTPRRHSEGAAA